ILGAVLVSAGYFFAGRVRSLMELYLSFTFIGIGSSTLYVPPVPTIARSFDKQQGLATGIAITALSFGLVFFSPLAQILIRDFGWRSTFLIFGASIAVILMVSILLMIENPDVKEFSKVSSENAEKSIDCDVKEAMRRRPFWYFYLTLALASFGVFAITVHIVPFAIKNGVEEFQASIALFLVGIFSILTRILGGWMAEKLGVVKMLIIFLCVQAISTFGLLISGGTLFVYLVASGIGIAWGGWAAAYPVTLRKFFGTKNLGAIMGAYELGIGMGGMAGPAIVGYIFDIFNTYALAFLLCGFIDTLAILISILLKRS
ncbi:MAG: MFS transporter, partial [Candidatus Hadarchaeum sp.]|uniref:MFS transporter n=1 Tax=Candidatus Hadarchaeum sp. TaxID=2883567 RepID=UPI0031801686